MNETQARTIMRAQEAKEKLATRALNEIDLKIRAVVNSHRKNHADAIQGVREILREKYAKELSAIPSLAGDGQRHNPDFSIAREIVSRLTKPPI